VSSIFYSFTLVNVRLLCGADLMESFSVPGLWRDEDVGFLFFFLHKTISIIVTELTDI